MIFALSQATPNYDSALLTVILAGIVVGVVSEFLRDQDT